MLATEFVLVMTDSPRVTIRDTAYDILTGYREAIDAKEFDHRTVTSVKKRLPNALDGYFSNKPVTANHAKFIGKMNHIPWVSLSHDSVAGAPQDGLYVVYLFDYQADQLILSLGHGTKKPKEELGKSAARDLLEARVGELRHHISLDGFTLDDPELEGETNRSDLWANATVCYKRYTPGEFPDAEEFVDDLDRLVETYLQLVEDGVPQSVERKYPASYDDIESRDADLYQVILKTNSDSQIWRNYEQTVGTNVSGEAIQDFFESDINDQTRLWGAGTFNDLERGDVVVFCERGEPSIQLVGRVSDRTSLDTVEDANTFAQAVGWEYDGNSPYTEIALFDKLWEPAVTLEELFEIVDYGGLPVGTAFQRIKTRKSGSSFEEVYGSVAAFETAATGELVFPADSSRTWIDHPLVDHAADFAPTVWTFTTGPSDILTNIRRSAVQVAGDSERKWKEIREGDIVLLRCKGKEEKIDGFDDVDRKGIVGVGIVSGKSRKTARWWWNEFDKLVYPFLIEFEELYLGGDLAAIDLTVPTYQRSIPTLESDIDSLLAGHIHYTDFDEIVQVHTDGGTRNGGEFQEHKFDDSPVAFLNAIVDRFDSLRTLHESADRTGETRADDREPRRDRLPAMLPREDKPSRADELENQIENTGQIVLYGPPGTGKTYTARRFVRWWLTESKKRVPETRFRTVTFHPSFAYEDFMEGLTAEATTDGQVEYRYKDGVFKKLCSEAREAYRATIGSDESPPAYVLLIDELNRGNLAKIFGEAVTQLELDKRLDGEEATPAYWAHSGEKIAIPPNLYLIGTMNTADQSITLVDAAIRRRFSFHSFPPDYDVVTEEYDFGIHSPEFEALLGLSRRVLKGINERIRNMNELGRGKQIGHSYLLGHENRADLANAWQFQILPLLEEYYFGDIPGLVADVFDIDESTQSNFPLIDVDRLQIADFDAEKLERGLQMLPQSED